MPIYVYRCETCGLEVEHYQKRADAEPPACAECGVNEGMERRIAGMQFHKDEKTQMAEFHPKYAKMVDHVWEKASARDPLAGTRFGHLVDSGKRVQDTTGL